MATGVESVGAATAPGPHERAGARERTARRPRRRVLPRPGSARGTLMPAAVPVLPRSIVEAARLLRARQLSAVELANVARERAHADPHNAWLRIEDDHADAQARAADDRLRRGAAPLLGGVPWACKDIIGTKGNETTAASRHPK